MSLKICKLQPLAATHLPKRWVMPWIPVFTLPWSLAIEVTEDVIREYLATKCTQKQNRAVAAKLAAETKKRLKAEGATGRQTGSQVHDGEGSGQAADAAETGHSSVSAESGSRRSRSGHRQATEAAEIGHSSVSAESGSRRSIRSGRGQRRRDL